MSSQMSCFTLNKNFVWGNGSGDMTADSGGGACPPPLNRLRWVVVTNVSQTQSF